MISYSRVLVPVDFSSCSKNALRFALQWADKFETYVDVVHAWQPPPFSEEAMMMVPHGPSEPLSETLQKRAESAMTELFDDLDLNGSLRIQRRVLCGEPFAVIDGLAKDEGYDLVILGTRGHGLMGSFAEKLVRTSTCPVLTLRSAEDS